MPKDKPFPESEVFIGSEVRLHLDSSSVPRTYHNAATFERWRPYRDALGTVSIVARLSTENVSDSGAIVGGPGVRVVGVHHYHGLKQMIFGFPIAACQILNMGNRKSLYIGRLPEPISMLLFLRARLVGARFVSVVASEPRQLFSALLPGLAGRMVGRIAARLTRLCVKRSVGVIYVTQSWLQGLYPAPLGTPTLARSNVSLPPEAMVEESRRSIVAPIKEVTLVTVATLENRHKGVDCLLEVVSILQSNSILARLVVIGSGRMEGQLQRKASDMGLSASVRFAGHLGTAEAIRGELDEADVFVLASRVEGLPRALIEAMARGLPVVATRAGGAAELVVSDSLCEIDDVAGISNTLASLVSDPQRMMRESQTNLAMARTIAESASEDRLAAFLKRLNR